MASLSNLENPIEALAADIKRKEAEILSLDLHRSGAKSIEDARRRLRHPELKTTLPEHHLAALDATIIKLSRRYADELTAAATTRIQLSAAKAEREIFKEKVASNHRATALHKQTGLYAGAVFFVNRLAEHGLMNWHLANVDQRLAKGIADAIKKHLGINRSSED